MNRCRWPVACTGVPEAHRLCRRHYKKMLLAGKLEAGLIPAAPTRATVCEHTARGRSPAALAKLAGVTHRAVTRIADGTTARIRRTTARRLAAVPLPPTRIGTVRRYRALARIGHNRRTIAAAGRIDFVTLKNGLAADPIPTRVSIAVDVAYRRLSGTPGDSDRARGNATRRSWVAPLGWEGADIDDPATRPVISPSRSTLSGARSKGAA